MNIKLTLKGCKYQIGDEVMYAGRLTEVTAISNYHPDHENEEGNWFYSLKSTGDKDTVWRTGSMAPVCESKLEPI